MRPPQPNKIFAPMHAPCVAWMQWTKANLPHAKNYWITDLDCVIRDRSGNMMILELKHLGATVPRSQRTTLELIDNAMTLAYGDWTKVIIEGYQMNIKYWGFHTVGFSGKDCTGQIYLDDKPVSQEDLIKVLTFEGL